LEQLAPVEVLFGFGFGHDAHDPLLEASKKGLVVQWDRGKKEKGQHAITSI
jgi:hypothetical protein